MAASFRPYARRAENEGEIEVWRVIVGRDGSTYWARCEADGPIIEILTGVSRQPASRNVLVKLKPVIASAIAYERRQTRAFPDA